MRGSVPVVWSEEPTRPAVFGAGSSLRAFVAFITEAAIEAANRVGCIPFFVFSRTVMQEITSRTTRRFVRDDFVGIDPFAAGRAAAAAAAVAARYAGLIDEVSHNLGLTPQQRAAAIASLRLRQSVEAAAESKKIMDAARGAAKMRRQMMKKTAKP